MLVATLPALDSFPESNLADCYGTLRLRACVAVTNTVLQVRSVISLSLSLSLSLSIEIVNAAVTLT